MHQYFTADSLFSSKIKETDTGCWEYTGRLNAAGYGVVRRRRISSETILAHRYALMLMGFDISDGAFVCHKCDNPSCCNPDHLFVGTHQDNMDDMIAKGRRKSGDRRGELNGANKLSWDDVDKIRVLYGDGVNQCELGAMFGVTNSTIHLIVNNKRWVR